MNPRAHFCVRRICITTNNTVPIKYITKKYHRQIFFTPKKPLIVRLRNRDVALGTMCPGAHFCVREICVITNNGVPIQHLPKNPNTISTHIFAIQPFQNIPTNFPSWRRYTFLRVRLRNQRFLPHPKNTGGEFSTGTFQNKFLFCFLFCFCFSFLFCFSFFCFFCFFFHYSFFVLVNLDSCS